MSTVTVSQAFVVSGGNINGRVVIVDATTIDGRVFVDMAKGNIRTCRLLGQATGKSRPLASTDVIEQLQKLRDTVFPSYCVGYGDDDLGLDDAPTKLQLKDDAPAFVQIEAPAVPEAGVDSVNIAVLLSKPTSTLQMEVTHESLQYMSAVAAHQIEHCDIKKHSHRDNVPEEHRETKSLLPGVSFCFKGRMKGSVRVIYEENTTTTTKKRKNKYFVPADGHDIADVIQEAENFKKEKKSAQKSLHHFFSSTSSSSSGALSAD
jgi:hypothetical protein